MYREDMNRNGVMKRKRSSEIKEIRHTLEVLSEETLGAFKMRLTAKSKN